ncbi:hypothetical protein HOM50_02600 [bacterium]|nr:hypothetical protein [bacterium]MBT5015271.1 hypothetical protein [bacterium]
MDPKVQLQGTCKNLSIVPRELDQPAWFQLYITTQKQAAVNLGQSVHRDLLEHAPESIYRVSLLQHLERVFTFINKNPNDLDRRLENINCFYGATQATLPVNHVSGMEVNRFRRFLEHQMSTEPLGNNARQATTLYVISPMMLKTIQACKLLQGPVFASRQKKIAAFLFCLHAVLE